MIVVILIFVDTASDENFLMRIYGMFFPPSLHAVYKKKVYRRVLRVITDREALKFNFYYFYNPTVLCACNYYITIPTGKPELNKTFAQLCGTRSSS